MTSERPLDDWLFLVGDWKGRSEDEFGGKGVIETSCVFTIELGDSFIYGKQESVRNGSIENQSISMMFYDKRNKKFIRKTFFNYGFVNNEVEYERSETEIRFEVILEPVPQAFDEMKWRSYIRKISDDEIRMGLEDAKPGEDFKSYGENVLVRV